jgi:hypothetical protein
MCRLCIRISDMNINSDAIFSIPQKLLYTICVSGAVRVPSPPCHNMTYNEASKWISRQSPGNQVFYIISPARR